MGQNGVVVTKISVHQLEGDFAPRHLTELTPDLRMWRAYYLQLADGVTRGDVERLASAMIDPVTQRVEIDETLVGGHQVQVAYKRGIVDNENDSIVEIGRIMGVEVVAARVATVYESTSANLAEVIGEQACNATIEELQTQEPHYDSLVPQGGYEPARSYDLRGLDDSQLLAVGSEGGRVLDLDKMHRLVEIQKQMGAEFLTDVFIEAMDARWSDHCAHTTWKSLGNLMGKLVDAAKQAGNRNVISMFHDNAGIWNFYDGYGIAIKAETHNGPSAVSAYFGQLTKIGGVLRDIIGTGQGADPIGVFEYTATGVPGTPSPIQGRPNSKRIAGETIRAVKEYGNTFGVPMMSSHMTFHPSYRAKPFALGGSIGLIPLSSAKKGTPQPGDHVVLVGGLTGNDGIHGASGSSAGAVMDATSVQIGSPLEEIKFREAILELRDADCIRAITDLGAAGLNSAIGEMGEDTGVWLNTALVPLKTAGLPMWRILLSESQERMALAIAPDKWDEASEILARHDVRNTVVGRFTGDDRYCVVHDPSMDSNAVIAADAKNMARSGEVGIDAPYEFLDYRPPSKDVSPPLQEWKRESKWPSLAPEDLARIAADILADNEVCDQAYASRQYDSSVQGRSWHGPFAGSRIAVPTSYHASRPVYGSEAAAVFNWSFNPWLFDAQPTLAARQTLISVLLGQVLAGVELTDICLTDNFYTPNKSTDADGWLVAMVNEIASLSAQFRTPFISGKDSSAGSVDTDEGVISVPPAVFISGLGKVPSVERLRPDVLTGAKNALVRIGLPTPSLAGTVASRLFDGDANDVDEVSPQAAFTLLSVLEQLDVDVAPSGRVIGAGGTLATAALLAFGSDVSIDLEVPGAGCEELLAEHRCAALIEVWADRVGELPSELTPVVVGRVSGPGAGVTVGGVDVVGEAQVRSWRTSFEGALS